MGWESHPAGWRHPPEVEINDQGYNLIQWEGLTLVNKLLILIRTISIADLSQSLPRILVESPRHSIVSQQTIARCSRKRSCRKQRLHNAGSGLNAYCFVLFLPMSRQSTKMIPGPKDSWSDSNPSLTLERDLVEHDQLRLILPSSNVSSSKTSCPVKEKSKTSMLNMILSFLDDLGIGIYP